MCFEMTAYGNDEFKGYEYGMAGLWVSLASYETADFFGPVLIDLYLGEPQPMPPCFSTLIISSLIKTDLSGTKTGYDYEIF